MLSSTLAVQAQTDPLEYIQSVAGNGDPAVLSPFAVAVDRDGTLYIAEPDNNRVMKLPWGGSLQAFAGNANPGNSGDEGPATAATFVAPSGVAVDLAGNVYIADTANHTVRMVTPDGIIHHFAGSASPGFDGDGGPASAASLFLPTRLAVDGTGNLYIADSNNQRIRKVTPNGTITTIAGNGSIALTGDEGSAIDAGVPFPASVAVDNAGSVYVAEPLDHVVRKITPDGLIHTVAGVPDSSGFSGDGGSATAAQLWASGGVAVDYAGTLYIADSYNQRIRKVTTNGIIHTIAGSTSDAVLLGGFSGDGGQATSAELNQPIGLALDHFGALYIADYANGRARRMKVSNTRTVDFSGYTWVVESSKGKVGPGPNFFSDDTDNVLVDAGGPLHLKITRESDGWHCAEVLLTRSLGYGTYRFYLNSPVDTFDPNVVFGIFTYDSNPAEHHRELDIEFSRWAKPFSMNAQYVIQPGSIPQNLTRFDVPPNLPQSTHSFRWETGRADFLSVPGFLDQQADNPDQAIMQHTFTSGVPAPGAEKLRFNLWLDRGMAPTNDAPAEVVIRKFEFVR
jgi:sugar lactone lactonase YvrE